MRTIDNNDFERLLASPTFIELTRAEHRFNLFQAFGVAGKETSYSRVIAYLLDPRQGHGLNTALFEGLWLNATGERPSVQTLTVQRERDWIAVVAESTTHLLAIENKVHAVEGDNQLGGYQEQLAKDRQERQARLVFLSPTGRRARNSAPRPQR